MMSADALVVGRHPADRQKLLLEYPLKAWTLLVAPRIGLVAAITIIVIDLATGGLLRRQPEFGIALTALHIAARKND